MRKRLTIAVVGALVLALVAVAALVGVHWWRDAHRTDLERAAAYAPSDAQRLTWTDWAAVRDRVGAHLDASSSGDPLTAAVYAGDYACSALAMGQADESAIAAPAIIGLSRPAAASGRAATL